ncbi:hypothetical protein ES703_14996 [subsurface metagenome]
MKTIWTFIRHNRGLVICISLSILLMIWLYGCHSQVKSIVNPRLSVTRPELDAEVANFLNVAELRYADLDRQDAFKRILFENAITYAQGGTVNPFAVLITLGGILGIGLAVDNRGKDVRIKTLKKNTINKT